MLSPPAGGLWSRPCSLPALLSTPGMFVYVPAVSDPGGNLSALPLASKRMDRTNWNIRRGEEIKEEQTILPAELNSVKAKTFQIFMKLFETLT